MSDADVLTEVIRTDSMEDEDDGYDKNRDLAE